MPYLAHLIQLDGAGGGPASVVEQLHGLREGYEQIVYHGGSGRIAAACEAAGIEHVQLPIDRAFRWPRGFFRFARELRRRRPDLLVLHGQWSSAPGAIAARAAGLRRIVYVARWPAFYTDWDPLRSMRNRLAEGIPCRLADRVVTLTTSSAWGYLRRGWVEPGRLVTIPNALDPSVVPDAERRRATRERMGWHDALCHVVSVGRLADQKRVDWLLRSWAVVRRSNPEARLWIAGDGPERERLRALAVELQLGSGCTFLGERSDAIELVAAGDVAVMTSAYESFGRSALEAMACGRPLVASDVDGLRDLITDDAEGFLVAAGDVAGFAGRIERLVRDPSLRGRMGQAGIRRAAGFSREQVMPRFRRLLDRLLG